jgi:hypothetical protein
MAGILTDYTADKHKKVALGIATYTAPSSLQAAVYTSSTGIKTNNPTGEASYTGYARATITFDANGANSPISFLGPPTQTTITHLGLIDVTADKILWAGALTTPKTLSPGEPLFFNTGDISISFDTIA